MALKLQSFKFVVVNHQFIYAKGVKPEEREKLDPEFVKLSGIACFDNFDVRICYILDSFQEFNMKKSELSKHAIPESLTNSGSNFSRSSGLTPFA